MKRLAVKIREWIPIGKVAEISPEELQKLLTDSTDSIQILDVRTKWEYSRGHIKGAVSVPIFDLAEKLASLSFDKEKQVIAICLSAHRSIPAVRILKRAGHRSVFQLRGGMIAWNKSFKNELVREGEA